MGNELQDHAGQYAALEVEKTRALLSALGDSNAERRSRALQEMTELWEDPRSRRLLWSQASKYAVETLVAVTDPIFRMYQAVAEATEALTQKGDDVTEVEADQVIESIITKTSATYDYAQALTKVLKPAGSLLKTIKLGRDSDETLFDLINRMLDFLSASYYAVGVYKVERGRWYEGLGYLEASLSIRRDLDDYNARADTIYQIARTQHLIGNFDKARTHYRDALRLYEHTRNQRGIAACKAGLGHLMTQIGFLDEAISDLKSARQIYRKLGDKQEVGKVEEVLQLAKRVKERQPA